MISDAIALYELLTKKWKEYKVISALFSWDGTKLEGEDKIEVEMHYFNDAPKDEAWFYFIKPINDYVFLRIPVNPGSVVESPVKINKTPDATYFRYVKAPDGFIRNVGHWPNVKTDFMVIGYMPKDLLKLAEGKL
ncbi:MAG: hypothetical protein KAQ84_01175 [Thermoplasmatales archaeon]|nr:hypothetical protein [Thermoplasmatales archaeon]